MMRLKKQVMRHALLNAAACILIALASGGVRADAFDELMQTLKNKGALSDDEFKRISAVRDAEKKSAVAAPAPPSNEAASRPAFATREPEKKTASEPAVPVGSADAVT